MRFDPANFKGGFQIGNAHEWIDEHRKHFNLPPCSEFGRVVATIVARAVAAPYNCPRTLYKATWESERMIDVPVHSNGLSTFDFDQLTRLVVLCHDACVRMEIGPRGFGTQILRFHPRAGRRGGVGERHPTIETAIEATRTGRLL